MRGDSATQFTIYALSFTFFCVCWLLVSRVCSRLRFNSKNKKFFLVSPMKSNKEQKKME